MNQGNADFSCKTEQQQTTSSIQANRDVKKLVKALEEKSEKYEMLKQAAEILSLREKTSPEMLTKLKREAEQYLEECVSKEIKTFLRGKKVRLEIRNRLRSVKERWTPKLKTSSRIDTELYRLNRNKWLAGVCSGLGEYYQIDTAIIRTLFIVGFIPPFTLISIAIYAILVYMLPLKRSQEETKKSRFAWIRSLWTPTPKTVVN